MNVSMGTWRKTHRFLLALFLISFFCSCSSTGTAILFVSAESTSPDVATYDITITEGENEHSSGKLPVSHKFITTGLRVGECKVSGTAYDSDGDVLVEYGYDVELRKGQQERLTLRFQ